MVRRRWFSGRQAYGPRAWPLVPAMALAGMIPFLVDLPWWGAIVLGAVLGAGSAELNWWVWKRRHPPVTVERVFELRREKAPWN